jgi:ATP-dependent DNA helicase RecQ
MISHDLLRPFGFESFRAGQEGAIQSLLNHQHTLVIMPTGAGKSLIYQLTALQLEGLTIVISPLIALMKDQVDALNRKSIPATFINSAIPLFEQDKRLSLLAQGKFKLIYVAPERLRNVAFLQSLQNLTLSLLAVDEAHCISEWGHDFRPDYLHILEARRKLGNPLTIALTATATPKVQNEIVRLLGLPDSTRRIVTGFNRSNLALEVKSTPSTDAKFRALRDLCDANNQFSKGAIIIYTGTRRDSEEVAEFMRVVCKLQAEHYHAGLAPEDRVRIQERFIDGSSSVIVATNAFGMGIDRADVRQVIHYSLPGSLEAYYQEAGRAGRDGLPARVVLLYDPKDRALQEFFIQNSVVSPQEMYLLYSSLGNENDETWMTIDDLQRRTEMHPVKIKVGLAELERVGALEHLGDDNVRMLLRKGQWDPRAVDQAAHRSKEHIAHRVDQLDHMVNYAETNKCRRQVILHHFGDSGTAEAPICCDNCEEGKIPPKETSGDVAKMDNADRTTLIILDCVRQTRVGRRKLTKILHGSKAQDILKFHYEKNPYYAKLAVVKQSDIEGLIAQLVDLGYLKTIGGDYPILVLTPRGENAINKNQSIALKLPKSLQSLELKKPKVLKRGQASSKHAAIRRIVELGESGSTDSLPELIDALNDKDGNVRRLAASALGKIKDPHAVSPLMNLLKTEIKPQVRQYAVNALGKLGDSHAIDILEIIAADQNEQYYTRDSAKKALQNCRNRKFNEVSSSPHAPSPKVQPDTISSYLSSSHPRPLKGSWHAGFALDFHSSFKGADWNRGVIGDLAFRLKYKSDESALPPLVEHTLQLLNDHPEMKLFDIIIPVSSSTQREFDPVPEFCIALSNAIHKPVHACLVKARVTKKQKEMHTLPQKRDNVAGAFILNNDIKGLKILVVDDLYDSGATLEEITKLLLKHKATRVNVLTLTRTIHADE